MASLPRSAFPEAGWPPEVLVIPEHPFAVDVGSAALCLSPEHSGQKWMTYADALQALTWDSNKVALYELNERLQLRISEADLGNRNALEP